MKCRYFCRLPLDISPVYLTRGISLRPLSVGDFSATAGGFQSNRGMGIFLPFRSVCMGQKKQTLLLLVLWLGLLDQRKCGNLSAGSKRAPQTQIGFCSSTDCFPHRAAQQKAGCSAGKNRCPYGGFAPD